MGTQIGDIRLGWVKLIMKSSNKDSNPTTGGVRKAGHTLEDRNKKKAGALYHALGSHSYPKKRGCSPPRTEVAKGGLALPESPRGLQLSTSWPELPVTVGTAPLVAPASCLGDPGSCLSLRLFLDAPPGPSSKARGLEALSRFMAMDL